MKLRWHIRRYKVTAQMVRDYQEIHGGGLMEAKNKLTQFSKELEYYDDDDGQWKPIPIEITETIPDLNNI